MHQPPWMCNNANCPFRNRLVADAKLTTPHVCPQPSSIPVVVHPFPPPKAITILPPPPLAPAPPVPFFFPPPTFPPSAPTACFPIPGQPVPMTPPAPMPPAPMPPGPFIWPAAPASAPPVATAQPVPEHNKSAPASPDRPKSPSIAGVVHEKTVHKLEPKKGTISKADEEALADFEERTRRQEYRDLAESSKQQPSHKSEGKLATKSPSKPRSILRGAETAAPAVSQEAQVNVYNNGPKTKAETRENAVHSSQSPKSVPAKDAASVREDAIKRAHSIAQGRANATAPAAMLGGPLTPPSKAGSHVAAKPSSRASAKATSQASNVDATRTTAPKAPSKVPSEAGSNVPSRASSKAPSTIKTNVTRGMSRHQSPLAPAAATANAQVKPPSIESWRESVRRPVPA